jgi:hypothetical protein
MVMLDWRPLVVISVVVSLAALDRRGRRRRLHRRRGGLFNDWRNRDRRRRFRAEIAAPARMRTSGERDSGGEENEAGNSPTAEALRGNGSS